MSMTPGATTRPRASMRRGGLRACEHAGRRDAGYSPAAQADVAVEPGVAGTVDDPSAGDDGLVRVGVRRRGCRRRRRGRTRARRESNGEKNESHEREHVRAWPHLQHGVPELVAPGTTHADWRWRRRRATKPCRVQW
jgi:hypothetical protein